MEEYRHKKVLILGLGVNQGGLGSAKFFAKCGAKVLVTDLKDERALNSSLKELEGFKNIKYTLGGHKFEDIDWADLIIKNQAIKPENEFIHYAKAKNKVIETDIGIFISKVNPKQIIGVTGSKGKTTTSSLIYYALWEKYSNLVLAGNIGISVLDALDKINKETLVVLELSSFQLEAFEDHKAAPKYAVITNIFPEHLNYYASMENYISAKRIIAKYQGEGDWLFLNKDDEISNSAVFLNGLGGTIIYFSSTDLPEGFKGVLPGEHNKLSYAAALAVSKVLGIGEEEALLNMNEFNGAEFRLQMVKKLDGIKIINDSAATNPDATIQALKTYPSSILICGGMDKNLDYSALSDHIDKYAKSVYFLDGTATDKIKSGIKHFKILRSTYSDLNKLLHDVAVEAQKGDTIVFSPGATSFNLFQNEFDRGHKFNLAVEKSFKIN